MAGREQSIRDEKFWRAVLGRRKRSGLTVPAFCKQEGLTASAFYYWQRKLWRAEGKAASPAKVTASKTPSVADVAALTPVQVIADAASAAEVEIVADNGYVVRVGSQATMEHLRRVLQVVREIA